MSKELTIGLKNLELQHIAKLSIDDIYELMLRILKNKDVRDKIPLNTCILLCDDIIENIDNDAIKKYFGKTYKKQKENSRKIIKFVINRYIEESLQLNEYNIDIEDIFNIYYDNKNGSINISIKEIPEDVIEAISEAYELTINLCSLYYLPKEQLEHSVKFIVNEVINLLNISAEKINIITKRKVDG